MATAKKSTKSVKVSDLPKEPELSPFHRLKYNVDRKRALIKEHTEDLVEMEYELQLRCPHYATEKYQVERPGDMYQKTILVNMIHCKECGLERIIPQ
jgi:hypothetical protein